MNKLIVLTFDVDVNLIYIRLITLRKLLNYSFKLIKQKKRLILNINNIKKFNNFEIRFQHFTNLECFLFDSFSCNEFVRPRRHESDRLTKRIKQESLTREQIVYLEIIF